VATGVVVAEAGIGVKEGHWVGDTKDSNLEIRSPALGDSPRGSGGGGASMGCRPRLGGRFLGAQVVRSWDPPRVGFPPES
jgi:hypothetical protein